MQLCCGQPVDPDLLRAIKTEVAKLNDSVAKWREENQVAQVWWEHCNREEYIIAAVNEWLIAILIILYYKTFYTIHSRGITAVGIAVSIPLRSLSQTNSTAFREISD